MGSWGIAASDRFTRVISGSCTPKSGLFKNLKEGAFLDRPIEFPLELSEGIGLLETPPLSQQLADESAESSSSSHQRLQLDG